MRESGTPTIMFSEWLPSGVMVHFQSGECVFYPAEMLYQQRGAAKGGSLPDGDASKMESAPQQGDRAGRDGS
jgi:hypothetical protein